MSIIGGAIIPAVMGYISDKSTIRYAFALPLACHAYVLYFALRGYYPVSIVAAVSSAVLGIYVSP